MFEEVTTAVRSVQRRALVVVILLLIGIALDSIGVVATFSQIGLLKAIARGVMLQPGVAASNDARMALVAVLKGLSYFLTAAAFLIWMVKARHNLPLLGARSLEYSPWWTVASFIVPILALIRPYQVMVEIWTASDPNRDGEQSWTWRNPPATLRWWWGSFLVMSICGTILTLMASDKSGAVIPRLISHSYFGIVKNLIDIAAALVTILMIQSVNGQQSAGMVRLLAAPLQTATPDTEAPMLDN